MIWYKFLWSNIFQTLIALKLDWGGRHSWLCQKMITSTISTCNSCIFYCETKLDWLFVGSSAPTPCPGGQYCQFAGLDTPTDNCSAGYYCTAMSITNTPTDGTTGDVCPPGFYCLAGSAYPTPCSPGTYSATQGNTLASHCLPCDFGEYCAEHNLTATSGKFIRLCTM